MRSDRRHELDSNDLADSATAVVERIRPYLGAIGLAAVGLVLVSAAWTFIDSRRAATREQSWDEVLAALASGQAPGLEAVATRHPGTPAAQWAGLILADGILDQGSQLIYVDRAQGEERLRDAANRYSAVLASTTLDLVRERATFGLAKARENLGQLDEARRGYEALVAEYPASAVRPFAEARIAALGRDATKQWYDWFAQQKPEPPQVDGAATESPTPTTGQPGAGPEAPPAGAGDPAGGKPAAGEPAAGKPGDPVAPAGAGTDAPGGGG